MGEDCTATCEAVEGCHCVCVRSPADHPGLHSSREQHIWGEEIIADRPKRNGMRDKALSTPRAERTGPPDVHGSYSGQQRKDMILPRVSELTEVDYKAAFFRQVHLLARTGEDFTSEDVTAVVGQPPRNPNSVGALMNSAASTGVIVRVGDTKAKRENQNATRISRWRGTSPSAAIG